MEVQLAFQQEDFEYKDLYGEDSYLQDVVSAFAQKDHVTEISKDLSQFSHRAKKEILELMWQAESHLPELKQYDHWGRRVDEILVDPAWNELHGVAAREGMIAIGYDRQSGASSRLHQFLKLMIFHPSSAFYTCPLAMTDGATRIIEQSPSEIKDKYFKNLISRDPENFWTAGQWMTEKAGGSDVSQSETFAEEKNGKFYLYGTKWFTSAITANIAMTLAQTDVDGEKKLSLFLVEIRDEKGSLNNIEVLRLKDKLGTKAMPTAELELKGVPATLIGEKGTGVKNIATVLNISRLYNSVCATGTIYRLHSLIRDYSEKRVAFGKKLIDHPLHQETLFKTQSTVKACVLFCAEMARLLGASEVNEISEEESSLLRLMTPIIKLWTGKKSVQTSSELVEAFGGAGYIEDSHLPRFLRDSQVFSIWEGTTNIMSLDALRAMSKAPVFENSMTQIKNRLNELNDSNEKSELLKMHKICLEWVVSHMKDPQLLERGARRFAFALGDLFCGLLLLEFSAKTGKKRDQYLAELFVQSLIQPKFQNNHNDEFIKETLLS